MPNYSCGDCGMEVHAITCGKCGTELTHVNIEKEDGTTVGVAECSNGCGKIKSPMCCGHDMAAADQPPLSLLIAGCLQGRPFLFSHRNSFKSPPQECPEYRMYSLLNQYSFVVIAGLMLFICWVVASRIMPWKGAVFTVFVVLIALTFFQQFQSFRHTSVETQEDWNERIALGKPILLELYSDY